MLQAWVARPEWIDATFVQRPDTRLRPMPLQRLRMRSVPYAVFQGLERSASAWLVLTSPASVRALRRWLESSGDDYVRGLGRLRIAAVGSGTRDQLLKEIFFTLGERSADAHPSSDLKPEQIIVAAEGAHADAEGLLRAMDNIQKREHFDWSTQTLLLIEGESNRPTLREGLERRGAHVLSACLYLREDAPWPEQAWQEIAQAGPGEIGIVVTSSTTAEHLMGLFQHHGIPLIHVVWCTHHATIAGLLTKRGISRVRRVRLDDEFLEQDLFVNEHFW